MCFSAQASFLTAAVLAPTGVYAFWKAFTTNRRYLLLSIIPLIFSLQQAIEGMLWLEFQHQSLSALHPTAIGFIFIAFLVWPIYLPLCAYAIEREPHRRKVMRWFPLMGVVYGLSVLIPIFMEADALTVSVFHRSIDYHMTYVSPFSWIYGFLYVLIAIFPFLYASDSIMKGFGVLAIVSLLISMLFFFYAMTSVWCYFVALISILVVYAIHQAKNL